MNSNLFRAISSGGGIVISAVDSAAIVEKARQLHDTSPTASAAFGRVLTASSLMGSMLKNREDSLTLRINGGGEIGSLLAVSDYHGCVRGVCDNPAADLPLNSSNGKLNVGGVVGTDGSLTVIRDIGLKEPYIGRIPLVSGEIAEDVVSYYAKSEQIPTACALGVLVDTDCSIKAAGGYLLQLLPFASDEEIDLLEKNLAVLDPVTTMLAAGQGPRDIIDSVLAGFEPEPLDDMEALYRCNCSRERMENALVAIGKDELRSIIDEDGKAEIVCSFCNKKYLFCKDELTQLCERCVVDKG